MTISSTNTKNSYSGDGTTVAFSYTFKILDDDDIQVILRTDATGTETVQTKTTDYTVSGVGNAGGGTITFGSAPAATETVVLLRNVPLTQTTDYTPNDPFPAATHEDALDKLTLMAQDTQEEVDRSIKLSRTNTMTSTEFTVGAATRANKIFAFDSSGELAVTQEIGTYQGTDTTTTTSAYSERDIVKSTTAGQLNNVYICVADSVAGDLLTDTDHFELLVDAVSAATSATNAATSATAAAASETAAAASESAAATSETNAATSESNASTSETNAATSETNAAASETAAAASETAAAASEAAAAASETAAAASETAAAASETAAAASESAASTSETNAAASETAAAASEAAAATSETNAATSASSAASDASAAATSAAAAAASFDAFDDIYLGAKASAPTQDNDGDALTEGDQYFNTTNNTLFVWNGSAWQAASPDIVGDTTPQLGGNLDLNSNNITGTGNIDVTGTVTADDSIQIDGNQPKIIIAETDASTTHNVFSAGGSLYVAADTTGVGSKSIIFRNNSTTQRMRIADGGDISFYDNTGTTQGLFWDASTQRLGLGTTGPGAGLEVEDANGIIVSRSGYSQYLQLQPANNSVPTILGEGGNGVHLGPTSTTGIRVDNAGSVGIGTASPASAAHISSSTYPQLEIDDKASRNYAMGVTSSTFRIRDVTGAADRLTIDSGGKVGIGTTSPSELLHLGSSNCGIRFEEPGGFDWRINNDGGNLNFSSDDPSAWSDKVTITNSGKVGIGTTSTGYSLQIGDGTASENMRINSSGTALISITSGTSSQSRLEFGDSGDDDIGYIYYDNSNNSMQFATNTSERLRIDSSGNVLVGKTASGVANTGAELQSSGFTSITRDGGAPLQLNRKTSDGDLFVAKKDGTTVGSIGVLSSRIYIGDSDTGLFIDDSNNAISPYSVTASNTVDNTIDLGVSGKRWKDLYLSGGAYIGGTAAANKLDDYEEGTFTPSFTSTGASFSYGVQGGNYTKVGRLVMCSFRVSLSAAPTGTTSNVVYLSGLPFSSATLSQTYHGGSIGHYFNFNLSATGVLAYQTVSGTSTTELKVVGDNLGETAVLASHLNSGAEIRGQVIYHAS